ncbi:MAG: hypothetical protein OSB14_02740 [Planctomycetota bacterium]|nr:hypothetical protein [Planctomycetota bacterium]
MGATRHDLARSFLMEAVYRSRNSQGLSSVFAGKTNCGLGEGPVANLDLTEKAQTLFNELWAEAPAQEQLDAIRATTRGWVERNDALDRDRNHFLRDFRQANGFDRTDYTPEQTTAYESGLDKVNSGADDELSDAARALLGSE